MRGQGYTHLRFFGIYPNGNHAFHSPTLDANGYISDPLWESVLPILVDKAFEHEITINFDGWEVIAESNRDTTELGVGYSHGSARRRQAGFPATLLRHSG